MEKLRKMKRISDRDINLCLGCDSYFYCPARLGNIRKPTLLNCHSGYSKRIELIKAHEYLIKKTMRLRGLNRFKSEKKIKIWASKLLDIEVKEINLYHISYSEVLILLSEYKKYVK